MSNAILCSYQPHIYKYATILEKKENLKIKLVEYIPNSKKWKDYYFPNTKSYDFYDVMQIVHNKELKIKKAPSYIYEDINTKTMIERNIVNLFLKKSFKNQIINSYYSYWEEIFNEIKPDNLIFEEEPHQLLHYICYAMAKHNKINTQMFNRTIANLGVIWMKRFEENHTFLNYENLKVAENKVISTFKLNTINKLSNTSHKELLKIHLHV